MRLFDQAIYKERRDALKKHIGKGLILIMGNSESAMNYEANTYHFRQNSNFLYYFGIPQPDLNAIIDVGSDEVTIFGNELTMDDIIWMGEVPTLSELAAKVGVNTVKSPSQLIETLKAAPKKEVHYLPPYRKEHSILLNEGLSIKPADQLSKASIPLIKGVVTQRSIKSILEIAEMEKAVNISKSMHVRAMQRTKEDKYEYEVVGDILKQCKNYHGSLAYGVIFSINGQVLHNHHHDNLMTSGRIVLNDSGAENDMGYAGDITRSFPVNGKFTQLQKEIYNIVLEMEKSCIEFVGPGIKYYDAHIHANTILINRFKELGLLNGDTDDMVAQGVAGLFMPHGLGHMIGLDVHDMEDLGENYVGYEEGQERASNLGLKSLRLAKTLQPGYTLTVEPGIYFIPQLIDKYKAEGKFVDFVNYDALSKYYDFGGIRIEDNVLITEAGRRVLGDPIPKEIWEVEKIMKRREAQ
jgi:Xaa-Pro aminopeptidase